MFDNEIAEDHVFSARFFAETGTRQRTVISAHIISLDRHPIKALQESWTFTRRSFDVRPADTGQSVVLYQPNQHMNKGESFFLPFNKDMPAGKYQITFEIKQGPSGFLALSRINPGVHEQRRFYRETYEHQD